MRSACLVLAALTMAAPAASALAAERSAEMVARGRYVATIGGCNDCHTPDYAMRNGEVPESLWLTGDALGWQGPWGTTYASNLRLLLAGMSEDQWVQKARTLTTRPPMPWFNVRKMEERDLRAFYRYVRSLGAPGRPAPDYIAPGRPAAGPVVMFPAPPK